IERRMPSLKRQAEKARIYKEKETKLREHEVSFLVSDLKVYSAKIDELSEKRTELKTKIEKIDQKVKKDNLERQSISNEAVQFDRKISKLNQEFTAVVEKISKLEVKKVSFESKQNGVKMADSDYRIE